MPEYYRLYCVCEDEPISLGMANLEGVPTTSYPVDVFNVNREIIGTVTNKDDYISVWNADPDNQEVGTLAPGLGPFNFQLLLNPGETAPDYVIGVPLAGRPQLGIYEIAYEDEYE